jgi:hypothetical protein
MELSGNEKTLPALLANQFQFRKKKSTGFAGKPQRAKAKSQREKAQRAKG